MIGGTSSGDSTLEGNMTVRPITAFTFAFAVSGCVYFMPADGGFQVAGTISPPTASCSVVLAREATPDTKIEATKVAGTFKESFVVAPYPVDYRVSVVCNDKVHRAATVRYGREVKPGQTVQLGTVAL
jgi:hypothetical protein